MKNIQELEHKIKEFDLKYTSAKSKNILVLDSITEKHLSLHKKYLILEEGEKPLLMLNGEKSGVGFFMPLSGFVLTNKKIYFYLLKNSFFTGIYPFRVKDTNINLENVHSFQIGEHDSCYGTAYVGHDLRINDKAQGLVRLGFSVVYDDKALFYINELSKYLFNAGLLSEEPKMFNWQ